MGLGVSAMLTTRRWTGRSMWRVGVRAAAVWAVVVGSLVVSSTACVAADPVDMAPKYLSKQSRDGWNLSISIEAERINSVPNLAAATTSREGFVSLSSTATAEGGESPITDSLFITGYQLGCQTDVSSGLGMGGSGAGGGNTGVANPVINPAAAEDSVGGAGGGAGFIQTTIQPGVIVEVPMTNMALSPDGRAMLDLENIHIKADACGGDVTIRSYAYLRVATALTHTGFAVYGDPLKI
jgi:MspA